MDDAKGDADAMDDTKGDTDPFTTPMNLRK